MSTYNKYINTLPNTKAWKVYCGLGSDVVGVPNVAYLSEEDKIKYLSVIPDASKEAVGSVYYSDGTFTLPTEDVDTTKTPIGVVVFTAADTPFNDYQTRIISLAEFDTGGTATLTSHPQMTWATSNVDTPITNQSSYKSTYVEDGKTNTNILVSNYGAECPAAYACSLYSTEGTEAGDWYLPSVYELKEGYYNNKSTIEATLKKLGSTYAEALNSNYKYWSSSEYSSNYAWYMVTLSGYVYGDYTKASTNLNVRAFLAV